MGIAQRKSEKDTITRKYQYGLRFGIDLSRPIFTFLRDNYSGLELVGDFRLSERWWIATELGTEEQKQTEELSGTNLYTYATAGNYLKLGGDYNTHNNWFGMRNQIHIGGRFAYSIFSQDLENFRFFNSNRFFNSDDFVEGNTTPIALDNLNASWLEFVVGMKAEVIKNTYIGISIRLGHLLSEKEPKNFKNLWIPGFNKVTEGAKWGVGFNYSLSYFLPLYKKVKKKVNIANIQSNAEK